MTRQLVDRLLYYMRDQLTLSDDVEWEPGEAAQWVRDEQWLLRMRKWFDTRAGE
tara:strand:+ start:264 stop:425 length:162 start_codon:yes stop_codon:yes gene_type:complete